MAPLVFLMTGGSTVELAEGENDEERAYRAMDWITSNGTEGVPDALLTLVDRTFFFGPFDDEEKAAAAAPLGLEPASKRQCIREDTSISVKSDSTA
jgi:hypothetical protein